MHKKLSKGYITTGVGQKNEFRLVEKGRHLAVKVWDEHEQQVDDELKRLRGTRGQSATRSPVLPRRSFTNDHENAERYLDSLNEDIQVSEGRMLSLSAHSNPQLIFGYLHSRNPSIAQHSDGGRLGIFLYSIYVNQ